MQIFKELFYKLFYNSLITSVYCLVRKSSIKIDSKCCSLKQATNYCYPSANAQYKICNNPN